MAETNDAGMPGNAETARENGGGSVGSGSDGGAGGAGGTGGVVTARDRFQRLSQEVQSRYQTVSEDVRRGAERATTEIRRGAEVAREGAREGYDKVRQNAGEWSRDLSFYVRDNPGKAVLLAAGVGFLFGMLVRRSREDDEDES